MRLRNKTAIVTGAGSGLGRAATERFAEEGATVVAADIDGGSATETADRIEANGGEALARELDVTDAERSKRRWRPLVSMSSTTDWNRSRDREQMATFTSSSANVLAIPCDAPVTMAVSPLTWN